MREIWFKFCSFKQAILGHVMQEEHLEDTLFVFPTESSKKAAIRLFQERWDFNHTLFITFEALKEHLFLPQKPLLKEEKRTLAFYASLDKKNRQFFKVNNYFQGIQVAYDFFNLWEEFCEELIDENIDTEALSLKDAELLPWQSEMYRRLLEIKRAYRSFLQEHNFDDQIFVCDEKNLNLQFCAPYKRFVFVNQFYYTKLEKSIIRKLQGQDKEVIIYYQVPQEFIDRDNLDVKEFSMTDCGDYQTEKVHLMVTKNDFSMFSALTRIIVQDDVHALVYDNLSRSAYTRFLALDKFNLSHNEWMAHSSIYRFFSSGYHLVNDLTYEEVNRKVLIPLRSMLDAAVSHDFMRYVAHINHEENPEAFREKTVDAICDLIDQDIKFVDLDAEFFSLDQAGIKASEPYLRPILGLVQDFIKIKSIKNLADWIDTEEGIDIKSVITEKERTFSNILEVFYRTLSDFSAIEDMGIVGDWAAFFSTARGPRDLGLSRGILRLFLEYLKSKQITYSYNSGYGARVDWSNLLDTRNMSYHKTAILDVTEGQLPRARQIPFLFNERQRQLLGLKTYDDIKFREKYYFQRLVFTTPIVYIFPQKNIERNIEISSFAEELRQALPHLVEYKESDDLNYAAIYQHFLSVEENPDIPDSAKISNTFFGIPMEKSQDFPEGRLNLSFSSYQSMRDNLFAYYIEHLAGITERNVNADPDLSAKLIGNVVHKVMAIFWDELLKNSGENIHFDSVTQEKIESIIHRLFYKKGFFYYKLPHNHSLTFFRVLKFPELASGIINFFQFFREIIRPENVKSFYYPEREQSSGADREPKLILSKEANTLGIDVYMNGRADLRVEHRNPDRYFIFDYKTGKSDREQLLFYELLYYVLEKPEISDRIYSYFYQIEEHRAVEFRDEFLKGRNKSKQKYQIFDEFIAALKETLARIGSGGYGLPQTKTMRKRLDEISRSDLYAQRDRGAS